MTEGLGFLDSRFDKSFQGGRRFLTWILLQYIV